VRLFGDKILVESRHRLRAFSDSRNEVTSHGDLLQFSTACRSGSRALGYGHRGRRDRRRLLLLRPPPCRNKDQCRRRNGESGKESIAESCFHFTPWFLQQIKRNQLTPYDRPPLVCGNDSVTSVKVVDPKDRG